ncbi:hypothetical protein QZH41_010759 [Actinostola sp. cb2023]|nr:hypothetical protein QZH41_010759 [Actinostola sp. cb2023]
MPKAQRKNYKGRSQNVLNLENSLYSAEAADVSLYLNENLVAGQQLAAKNQGKALDDRTMRLYETRLLHLEEFALNQGDDAILFGANKRPFLAVTIVTFLQKKCERKGKKMGSLICEGLTPPVVNGYKSAFRYWFNAFGHTGPYTEVIERDDDGKVVSIVPSGNPMEYPGVKQLIKQLIKRAKRPSNKDVRRGRQAYEPKKAPPFMLDDLLRMRNYCFMTIEGLRGLWLWTVTLFSFSLFLRGEEPLRLKLKHLTFPEGFDAQSGNIPHRIEVKIPFSKADRQAKGI